MPESLPSGVVWNENVFLSVLEQLSLEGSSPSGEESLTRGDENGVSISNEIQRQLNQVADFSLEYQAMKSLQAVLSPSSSPESPFLKRSNMSTPRGQNATSRGMSEPLQNYTRALTEFQESQIATCAVSLFNVEDETMDDLEGKKYALADALHTQEALSVAKLTQWYTLLSSKPKGRPESNVISCPVGSIDDEIRFLVTTFRDLDDKGHHEHAWLRGLTLALTAFVAMETIKPNRNMYDSQLAHVVLTWTLQHFGIPLLPLLHQNPTEKLEYIVAMEHTRKNICFAQSGPMNHLDWHVLLDRPGLLSPLLALLVKRLSTAIDDWSLFVDKKGRLAAEEAEARTIRKARELQSSEGTCIICLDSSPNIATLCCGRAVHLNCIAEWLRCHSSCPQCRNDLPSLHVPSTNHFELPRYGAANSFEDESVVNELLTYLGTGVTDDSSSSSSSSESSSSSSASSQLSSLDTSSSSSSSSLSVTTRVSVESRSFMHYESSDDDDNDTSDGDGDGLHPSEDEDGVIEYFSQGVAAEVTAAAAPSIVHSVDRMDFGFNAFDPLALQRSLRAPWLEESNDDEYLHSRDRGRQSSGESRIAPAHLRLSFLEPSLLRSTIGSSHYHSSTTLRTTSREDSPGSQAPVAVSNIFSGHSADGAEDVPRFQPPGIRQVSRRVGQRLRAMARHFDRSQDPLTPRGISWLRRAESEESRDSDLGVSDEMESNDTTDDDDDDDEACDPIFVLHSDEIGIGLIAAAAARAVESDEN